MSKKSADDWKKDGDALKATIVAAKKKNQNFGLVICKEGMFLAAHPTHSPDKLFKEAKNSPGGSAKGVKGKMSVSGTQISFAYEGELPGGFEDKFKQYMAKAKVKGFTVEFTSPKGDEAAKTAAEAAAAKEGAKPAATAPPKPTAAETAAAAPPASSKDAPPKPEAAKAEAPGGGPAAQDKADGQKAELSKDELAKNFEHISEIFKLSYPGMDEAQVKELKAALKAISGAIASGDLVGAQNMMNKLGLLTGVRPDSPMQPIVLAQPKKKDEELSPAELKKKKKELTKAMADLKADLQQTMAAAEAGDKQDLQKLVKSFQKQFKANELGDAEDSFGQIKAKVDAFLEAQKNLEETTASAAASASGSASAAHSAQSPEQKAPGLSPERKKARADELAGLQKDLDDLLATL